MLGIVNLIMVQLIRVQQRNCEMFYRQINLHSNTLLKEENECWNRGQYFKTATRQCSDFSKEVTEENVKLYKPFREAEIKHICKQMWLRFDNNLGFCVRVENEPDPIERDDNVLPIHRAWLKRIENPTPQQTKQMDEYNYFECLNSGRDYDYTSKDCDYLNINPMERDKISKLNNVLTRNESRDKIWTDKCQYLGLWYSEKLRMCITKEIRTRIRRQAIPNITYAGSEEDHHERHLYCVLLGMNYDNLRDVCKIHSYHSDLTHYGRKYYHIYVHAKEIICSRFGMMYQRNIDLCYQIPEIRVRIKKRHVDLCLDISCNQDFTTDKYGPYLRLIVSKNDAECFRFGMHYQKSYHRCEYFERNSDKSWAKALRFRYLPHLHQMLRTHCYHNNMDYLRGHRVCIAPKGITPEYTKEQLKINDIRGYEVKELRNCVKEGFDYDIEKDFCICYPEEFTENDYKFFKKFQPAQVYVACIASDRQYIKEIDFCPLNSTNLKLASLNKKQLLGISMSFENQKISLVKNHCHDNQLEYHPIMKMCIQRFSDKSRDIKYTYMNLIRKYCMNTGRLYDMTFDACVKSSFEVLKRKNKTLLRVEQLRSMCEFKRQEYDMQFGFCVMTRQQHEIMTPMIPIIKNNMQGDEICLKAGMMFNRTSNSCEHFPLFMSKEFEVATEKKLRQAVDRLYEKFCKLSKKPYDQAARSCGYTRRAPIYTKRGKGRKERKVFKNDAFYCFLEGLVHTKVQTFKYACIEYPSNPNDRKRIGEANEYFRRMYIHHRCPIYSTYHEGIKFCVRRPPKEFDIIANRKYFYETKVPPKGRKNEQTVNIRAAVKCCISNGLMYKSNTHRCVRYRIRPTSAELMEYKKYEDIHEEIFADYCNLIKMAYHELDRVCFNLDVI